ncbi:DNA-protecting protein DprA [Candidatus Methylospira mobilis]|uniref:DNA-protecting protein DprA n=1 Tax=Candidatus Methylospira mobilis TaxID=1808979 RepID=A0A5Q0BSM3_9GAMM|nr:DNA-protecting protein DprA [Candidatus Methylospira mobilis]
MRTPGIGARKFLLYREFFGSPQAIFESSATSLKSAGFKESAITWIKKPDWALIETDLAWAAAPGQDCLLLHHPDYPERLKEIPDPPPVLFAQGSVDKLSSPQLAIVGSRNPSPAGAKVAHKFAHALVELGLTITSGLALGIDAASHRGALDGGGATVAVTGTGLDQVYPAQHRRLAADIIEQGGVLASELPLGAQPLARNFPRRNRIISGLSAGTLVVEAALRSGSLITARMALEQGREVFAMPGSLHNPLARGCNALIKQGAKLVETVDDIIEELQLSLPALSNIRNRGANSNEPQNCTDDTLLQLLKYIAYEPTSVDTLITETGKTPDIIAQMLLTLELDGRIISSNGGYSRV